MGWTKSTRIAVMLAIDVAFFALELGVGIYVGSLALLADAFHMLNDIISLLVGLWAVIVARKATSDKYTYGWLRAEILGAFFNAVFLIALCVSIILEAITRFIEPPEIKNPQLILIVGSLGLASNLVGFFVLGGHGHSHGHSHDDSHAHSHSHGQDHGAHAHEERLSRAEEGYSSMAVAAANDSGPAVDVLPEVAVARATSMTATTQPNPRRIRFSQSDAASEAVVLDRSESRVSAQSASRSNRGRLRSGSSRHSRLHSIDDIAIHPASFRQEIIAASRNQAESSSSGSSCDDESAIEDEEGESVATGENEPLLTKNFTAGVRSSPSLDPSTALSRHQKNRSQRERSASRVSHGAESRLHAEHHHKKPKKAKKGSSHGHDHGDMGMNAMVLHVLGDALGNVGVIATALIIWLTDWTGKYYADPAVSLFITIIILRSAFPLTLATSRILLQATPDHLEVSEIREDIESLPGVVSCHHIHIWQLSDTQLVASMHIHVEFPISEAGGDKYMTLARSVRNCLHEYGIHSATIQPEFCTDDHHLPPPGLGGDKVTGAPGPGSGSGGSVTVTGDYGEGDDGGVNKGDHSGSARAGVSDERSPARSEHQTTAPRQQQQTKDCAAGNDMCLLECVDNCAMQGCCRSATVPEGSVRSGHSDRDGHQHSHGHGHGHGHGQQDH